MITARIWASRAGLLDWLPESVTATAAAHAAAAAASTPAQHRNAGCGVSLPRPAFNDTPVHGKLEDREP